MSTSTLASPASFIQSNFAGSGPNGAGMNCDVVEFSGLGSMSDHNGQPKVRFFDLPPLYSKMLGIKALEYH